MQTHLQYMRHSSGVFLSALLFLTLDSATSFATSSGQTTSFEKLFSTNPNNATVTPLCDEAQLKNVAQQVAQLKISSENIFLLLDSYNLRLDHIKILLDERLPEVRTKPHWIDVRGGAGGSGESISSTHASTGGVLFPGLNTQSSASGANIPAASSQSSASGDLSDLPVISTQSSAGGNNIPATDSQSSAAGANIPATDSQSATGGSFVSPTDSSSSSCGCNPQTSYKSGLYGALCPYSNPVLPPTCAEAVKLAGANAKSGVYHLYLPDSGLKPFYAYCLLDTNGGTAWTVVQRRQDGSISFHRNWEEYQTGFGNWNSEYFIGLERLHGITHAHLNELWVQMEDFENVTRYARYENFAIGDEHEAYALNMLGKFEGNAGDSLRTSQGQKFSTKDADHDMWDRNCAAEYTGAWWYNACHDSNLNGQYLRGKYSKDKYGKGIDWTHWHGHEYSLKYVHMAVRAVQ